MLFDRTGKRGRRFEKFDEMIIRLTLSKKIAAKAIKKIDIQTDKRKGQLVIKGICHKGFSRYSRVVARSNFRVGGQDSTPQTLTAHIPDC